MAGATGTFLAVAKPGYQHCVVSLKLCSQILSACFAQNLCSQLTTQHRRGSATTFLPSTPLVLSCLSYPRHS
jgi:hypothetical protein